MEIIMASSLRGCFADPVFHENSFQTVPCGNARTLSPKIKNPLGASGSKRRFVAGNYRIAPRSLCGWVPKSKPIRVAGAMHERIVMRERRPRNEKLLRRV